MGRVFYIYYFSEVDVSNSETKKVYSFYAAFFVPAKIRRSKDSKKKQKKQQTWIQKTNKEQQERTSILGSGAYVVF